GNRMRNTYRRYCCSGFTNAGKCGFHSIREDKLLPVLVRKIQEVYLEPGQLEKLRETLRRKVEAKYRGSPEQADRLRDRIGRLDGEIKQGARNLLRAGDNFDLLSEEVADLRRQRDKLARELEALERSQAVPADDLTRKVDAAIAKLRRLREELEGADRDKLR